MDSGVAVTSYLVTSAQEGPPTICNSRASYAVSIKSLSVALITWSPAPGVKLTIVPFAAARIRQLHRNSIEFQRAGWLLRANGRGTQNTRGDGHKATAVTPAAASSNLLPTFSLYGSRFIMIASTLRLRSDPVTPDTQTNGDFR